MHFVYKTGNLFRSIRVLNENSSVTKGFHFFWTYLHSKLFVCSKCTIQSHIINFQPFLISFVIFHAFTDFFELYDPEIEKHYKWTLKRLKVGMVSSFHHIACYKKLRGLRQKLDALRVQNGQSLSMYQGFGRKLICYKGISFFELIWTLDFLCVENAPFKATSSIFNPFWLHLVFFMHLLNFLS
jgi:hypothetical protein